MKKYVKLLLLVLISVALLIGCDIFEKQEELDFTIEDTEAPVPGGGGALSFDYNSISGILTISWAKAKDDMSGSSKLKYTVYSSLSGNIGSVKECEANGGEKGSGTNISSLTFNSYNSYYNVVVEDEEGNKACYIMQKYPPTDT